MKPILFAALLLAALLSSAAPLPAAEPPLPAPDDVPALYLLRKAAATIIPVERRHGLDAYAVATAAGPQMVYVTPDGGAFLTGLLYNADGHPVSAAQLAAARPLLSESVATTAVVVEPATSPAVPPPTAPQSPGDALLAALEAAAGFHVAPEGMAPFPTAPEITVVVDPRCPYCKRLYQALDAGPLRQGRLRLRIVPLGILGNASVGEATALLAAPDPAAAWRAHAAGTTPLVAPDPDTLSPDLTRSLAGNHSIFQRQLAPAGANLVPLTIYRNAAGRVRLIKGVPNSLDALLADLPPATPAS